MVVDAVQRWVMIIQLPVQTTASESQRGFVEWSIVGLRSYWVKGGSLTIIMFNSAFPYFIILPFCSYRHIFLLTKNKPSQPLYTYFQSLSQLFSCLAMIIGKIL